MAASGGDDYRRARGFDDSFVAGGSESHNLIDETLNMEVFEQLGDHVMQMLLENAQKNTNPSENQVENLVQLMQNQLSKQQTKEDHPQSRQRESSEEFGYTERDRYTQSESQFERYGHTERDRYNQRETDSYDQRGLTGYGHTEAGRYGQFERDRYSQAEMDRYKMYDQARVDRYGQAETARYGQMEMPPRYDREKPDTYGQMEMTRYDREKPDRYDQMEMPSRYDREKPDTYGQKEMARYEGARSDRYSEAEMARYDHARSNTYGQAETARYGHVETDRYGHTEESRYGHSGGLRQQQQQIQTAEDKKAIELLISSLEVRLQDANMDSMQRTQLIKLHAQYVQQLAGNKPATGQYADSPPSRYEDGHSSARDDSRGPSNTKRRASREDRSRDDHRRRSYSPERKRRHLDDEHGSSKDGLVRIDSHMWHCNLCDVKVPAQDLRSAERHKSSALHTANEHRAKKKTTSHETKDVSGESVSLEDEYVYERGGAGKSGYYCKICNHAIAHRKKAIAHIETDEHLAWKRTLQKKGELEPLKRTLENQKKEWSSMMKWVKPDNEPRAATASEIKTRKQKQLAGSYCHVCQKQMVDFKDLVLHLQGSQHATKLKLNPSAQRFRQGNVKESAQDRLNKISYRMAEKEALVSNLKRRKQIPEDEDYGFEEKKKSKSQREGGAPEGINWEKIIKGFTSKVVGMKQAPSKTADTTKKVPTFCNWCKVDVGDMKILFKHMAGNHKARLDKPSTEKDKAKINIGPIPGKFRGKSSESKPATFLVPPVPARRKPPSTGQKPPPTGQKPPPTGQKPPPVCIGREPPPVVRDFALHDFVLHEFIPPTTGITPQQATLPITHPVVQAPPILYVGGMPVMTPTVPVMPRTAPTVPVMPRTAPTVPVLPYTAPTVPVRPHAAPTVPLQPSTTTAVPVQPSTTSTFQVPPNSTSAIQVTPSTTPALISTSSVQVPQSTNEPTPVMKVPSTCTKKDTTSFDDADAILRCGGTQTYCVICKRGFYKLDDLTHHLSGAFHMNRLKEKRETLKHNLGIKDDSTEFPGIRLPYPLPSVILASFQPGFPKKLFDDEDNKYMYFCKACGVRIQDIKNLAEHLQGKKHYTHAANYKEVPDSSDGAKDLKKEMTIESRGYNTWFCNLCDWYMNDWQIVTVHIRSKAHLTKKKREDEKNVTSSMFRTWNPRYY